MYKKSPKNRGVWGFDVLKVKTTGKPGAPVCIRTSCCTGKVLATSLKGLRYQLCFSASLYLDSCAK